MERKSTLALIKEFKSPLTSVILMMLGSGFFMTFLSIYLNSTGYTSDQIGYIHSAYYLGMLIGAFKMDIIIRKINHVQALTVFGSIGTSAIILQALIPEFKIWILLRFINGISIAAIYVVIESWMLHFSTLKTRGTVLSLYMISLYFSQSISQQFIPLFDLNSVSPFLLSALFTALSTIPIGLTGKKIELPPEHHLDALTLRKLITISPFGVSGCLVAGLILSSVYSFFPLLAELNNLPGENVMTITIAGGVLLQWPLGKLSDIFERRKTLVFLVFTSILIMSGAYLYPAPSPTTSYIFFFLIGGLSFTLYPLSITQVCDRIHSDKITAATGFLLLIYGVGAVIGPLITSNTTEIFGIHSILLLFVSILTGLTSVGIHSMLRRPIVPLEEQTDFVPLSPRTPVAYEMDPRQG